MGAIGFDTLQYARKLKAAGVPDGQAAAQAEIMGEAFLLNMDALVTKDYLDAKFAEQDARIDTRFVEVGARFATVDTRFDRMEERIEAQMDVRFAEQDGRMDIRFAEIDGKFRLVAWMLAVVIASTVIPAVHQLLS